MAVSSNSAAITGAADTVYIRNKILRPKLDDAGMPTGWCNCDGEGGRRDGVEKQMSGKK